jgi:uncharacterized protein (TIGR01244 family)
MTKSFLFHALIVLSLGCVAFSTQAAEMSRALSQYVSVTGNMDLPKFEALIQQGFKSVIVNRPDEENGNAIRVNQLRNIAEKSQISVIYQPVQSGKISATDVQEFAKYYNELPKPVLMICRSGTRSSSLYNQAKAQGLLDE